MGLYGRQDVLEKAKTFNSEVVVTGDEEEE
jgi:hypothetical protein